MKKVILNTMFKLLKNYHKKRQIYLQYEIIEYIIRIIRMVRIYGGYMEQLFLDNKIYQYLKEKKAHNFINMIDTTYSYCDDILKMIPKEFSNYTLHDIGHAIRVINYMTEFVADNLDNYSYLHLAMIIISGLMHDTGMFVSDSEKIEIIEELMPEDGKLSQEEKQTKFQDYIRKKHADRVSSVIHDYALTDNNRFVNIFRVGKSFNIADDIALICKAHTESCEWIKNNIPNKVNKAEYQYNPQQIALLLRIGDNLDIDDRRAPAFLAQLLEVRGYSQEEWEKHPAIQNYDKIEKDGNEFSILFDGECSDSFIYRKVQEHIDWLEKELSQVRRVLKTYSAPYKFELCEKIKNTIRTKGFEATSLKFSLDYERVVALLMGENIYGDKRAGLRELLQNSIDAVMVMKEQSAKNVISTYSPMIVIELDKNKNIVAIQDNGTGMTENIVSDYFFNIGKSFYTSEEYKNYHLDYSAIGHYGIGFLACFMLSTHVLLETKNINDNMMVIEFEKYSPYVTKKVGKRNIFDSGHGTRITLDYSEIIGSVFEDEAALIDYVKELLLADGYTLTILQDGMVAFRRGEEEGRKKWTVSTKEFDINYRMNTFPHMIEDCMQLLPGSPVSLFLYNDDLDKTDSFTSVDEFLFAVESCDKDVDDSYYDENDYDADEYDDTEAETYIIKKDRIDLLLEQVEAWAVPFLEMLELRDDLDESVLLIDVVSQAILNYCYDGAFLRYVRIPFLDEANTLEKFKVKVDENGYDAALKTYKPQLKYFYIAGGRVPSPEVVAMMANQAVDACGGDVSYDEDDYSNSFTFKPVIVKQRARKIGKKNSYIPIRMNVEADAMSKNSPEKIYMHGVKVEDEKIVFPCIIKGTKIDGICVNVKTNDYQLNVSRRSFESESGKKLACDLTKAIFLNMVDNAPLVVDEEDKEAMRKFIEEDICY